MRHWKISSLIFLSPLIFHKSLPVVSTCYLIYRSITESQTWTLFGKRKVMTNEAYCLNPPQLTSWNQQLHKKQKRDYTSWTGTWLGPLFSILTHCLCSCKGGTCGKRKRNMVSGATTHERRETSCQMPLRRKINLLSHSFIHSFSTH